MSVPELSNLHHVYTASAGQTQFAYNFLAIEQADITVYVDGAEVSDFTVSGLGVVTGGIITLTVPLAAGQSVAVFGDTVPKQSTTYTRGGSFPAASHERALDRLARAIQDVKDRLRHAVRFPVWETAPDTELSTIEGQALKLLQVNATEDGLTYYTPSFTVLSSVATAAGYTVARVEATVNTSAGDHSLVSTSLIPAGSIVEGVIVEVTTTFGNTNGLTGIHVGYAGEYNKWGTGLSRTLGAKTNAASFSTPDPVAFSSATDVILSSVGGAFDATGVAQVWVFYKQFTPTI